MVELAKLGGAELLSMAVAGTLERRHLALAAEGAEKYRAAIAAGDLATERVARERSCGPGGCAECPAISWTASRMGGVAKGWCGMKFEERLSGEPSQRSCGCLVLLSIDGKKHPGPKPWVKSEACPRGNW